MGLPFARLHIDFSFFSTPITDENRFESKKNWVTWRELSYSKLLDYNGILLAITNDLIKKNYVTLWNFPNSSFLPFHCNCLPLVNDNRPIAKWRMERRWGWSIDFEATKWSEMVQWCSTKVPVLFIVSSPFDGWISKDNECRRLTNQT